MTKISVIIPIYNVEKYLRECLDSVINQTLKDIEIICINDGSPDNSGAIIDEYAQKDSRIKVIHKENEGVSIARNLGINTATGEFVCFMDPDDLYPTNDILETLYNKAKENNVLIAGGEFSIFDENINPYEFKQEFGKSIDGYLFKEDKLIKYQDYQFDYGHTRFIYNREFLIDNNIYYPNYKRFEDPVFFVKALFLAKKFYALNKITYGYRDSHKGVSFSKKAIKDCFKGIYDNLKFAKTNNLYKLGIYSAERFSEHYSWYKPYLDREDKNFIKKFYQYKKIRSSLLKKKIKAFVQSIFSIKKSQNQKHKIITILGIQLKIKRKLKLSNKIEGKTIPVVIACDNNYIIPTITCMYSILEKTNSFINFIILQENFTKKDENFIKENLIKFDNFNINYVNMKQHNLNVFPIKYHYSSTAFARYFIPLICSEYHKVIYTDPDVIFMDDIEKYYSIELDGYGIAATPEEIGCDHEKPWNHEYRKELFGINSNHLYFANGNLIIDCDYWRKNNITEKLVDKTIELHDILVCPDLDIMNIIFQNNYKKLDYKYCCCVHRYNFIDGNSEMENAFNEPFIIHYSGWPKPWLEEPTLFIKEYKKILKNTKCYAQVKKNYKKRPLLQRIFSIINHENKKHKIITILGFKIKIKRRKNA